MSSHLGSFCWSLVQVDGHNVKGKTMSPSEDIKYKTDMAIFEEKADSCCLKAFMGSAMCTEELMGQEQGCGPFEELTLVGDWLNWIGLLRETEGVIREERETNMWRVHLGGGSLWHRDHFVSQKQLATTIQ